MMDYTANTLRATIRALDEVVRPVVDDSSEAQATGQLDLVLDSLRFLELRLADLPRRIAFLLATSVELACTLADEVHFSAPDVADKLRAVGRSAGPRAGATRDHDRDRLAEVTAVIRDALRTWPDLVEPGRRNAVARHVLASERRRIEADRAWFAPMGFDTDRDSLLDLDVAFAASNRATGSAGPPSAGGA